MTSLQKNSWGKSGVRLVHVERDGDWHAITDLLVFTSLCGDTTEAYESGSNATILTTDAQKNAVYGIAAEHPPHVPELFALELSQHFLQSLASITSAEVSVEQRGWRRSNLAGHPAPHSFHGGGPDIRIARAEVTRTAVEISGGIGALPLLNTTGSEFSGFPRDRFTTGSGAADRILATELDARWSYSVLDADLNAIHGSVRSLLIETFGAVYSKSIQYSMRSMADAVFGAHVEIASITFTFPNLHHYPVDLSPFGIDGGNTVFATAHDPHSLIKASFSR